MLTQCVCDLGEEIENIYGDYFTYTITTTQKMIIIIIRCRGVQTVTTIK
jgi:hypothetical protein